MKKILVTRRLLRQNEERILKLWDANLNSNDEVYSSKKLIDYLLNSKNDLQSIVEKKHSRIRTLLMYLDHDNFDGGDILLENSTSDLIVQEDGEAIDQEMGNNPHGTPDPTATFPNEVFFVDRKTSENRDVVEFELAAAIDMAGVKAPKRQCTRALFPSIGTFLQ